MRKKRNDCNCDVDVAAALLCLPLRTENVLRLSAAEAKTVMMVEAVEAAEGEEGEEGEHQRHPSEVPCRSPVCARSVLAPR